MAHGKPFTPGVSGNPAGRPRGRGLKAEIEAELAEGCAGYIDRAALIARKLVDLAEGGDLKAIELLLKRVWPEKLAMEHDHLPTIRLIDLSGDGTGGDAEKSEDCAPAVRAIDRTDGCHSLPAEQSVAADGVCKQIFEWRRDTP